VFLTSLVVRREAEASPSAPVRQVEAALNSVLSTSPPEHHRLRSDGDVITVVCFLAAGSGPQAQPQVDELRRRVAAILAALPGWSLAEGAGDTG
jgi:hypothetical protein